MPVPPPAGVYIDGYLLAAIGGFFTLIVIPGVSALFVRLWIDRSDAYKENIALLKAQFADADTRKSLWTTLGDTVKDSTREMSSLKQEYVREMGEVKRKLDEVLVELRRKNP